MAQFKKPEYVNLTYKMAARYLVSNYIEGIRTPRTPLKVIAYPEAKTTVTPSDGCPNPTHWSFLVHNLLDVETISACCEERNSGGGVILESKAVVNVINEMNKNSSYTDASALFIERIAKGHGFNTDGLWCRATPRLKQFLSYSEG